MKSLSIIIPVYNEEKNIVNVLNNVDRVKIPLVKEVIIVDDCSSDDTHKLLSKLVNREGYKILLHDKNRGKGAAVRTGLAESKGDVVLIQDADEEYSPADYPFLLEPILCGEADVVFGNRFRKFHKPKYKLYYLGNKILTFTTNLLFGSKLSDMETCYKVFRRHTLNDIIIKSDDFGFEPEITVKFLKKGYKIVEVPIHYNSRSFGEGKKIGWLDGMKAFFYLIKYRFVN